MHEGLPGLDGLSAYEIARAKGFNGTAQEWLASLKGEPGRDGKDGISVEPAEVRALVERAVAEIPRPQDGTNGRDGKDGKNGSRGLKGDTGPAGADASQPPRVPWQALFTRDEDTEQTLEVNLQPQADSGLRPWKLIPIRPDGRLMSAVGIYPM